MVFWDRSELTPIRTHRVPQTAETPVTFVPVPNAYVRFAYSRSSDSMASHVEGQDYLCFQHNDQRFVFVIADGVGSSFCGNLAARTLGDHLIEWLWSLDIGYLGGSAALNEAATSYLSRLQKQAQHEVEEYEIPDEISGLVRQALEAQRAYGSEAVFAAVRIDHPSATIPDGLLSILWMGDTQIYVFNEDGEERDLGGTWDNTNRWSTTKGVRGQMDAWMQELKGIGRIISFTDGLAAHAAQIHTYADSKLDREIHAGTRLPSSDDIALIDLVLRTPRYEGYPNPDLPDPNLERPHLEQIWNPTGSSQYELRWNWHGGGKTSFIVQEATNPALTEAQVMNISAGQTEWRVPAPQAPGHYYYRVRGINRRGIVTPWSELRQTKVAYPPPSAPTLKLTGSGTSQILEWEGEGETLEYVLEQAAAPDFAEAEVVYEGRGTSWSVPVSTYKPGIYYYRVRAISDGGSGPWSDGQEIEVVIPPPPRPHLATASYGFQMGAYELRWQPVPGASYYELEEKEGEGGKPEIHRWVDTVYVVTDQARGEYVYRVRACHDFGCSEWSNEQRVIVVPQPPPEAPVLTLERLEIPPVLRLHWNEVSGAEEYVVEASDEENFQNARVYTQEGLALEIPLRREPGTTYFRVGGVNAGGQGPWSKVERISIAPKSPAWLEAEVTGGGKQVLLTWGAVDRHMLYVLEQITGSEDTPVYKEIYRGEDTRFLFTPAAGTRKLAFRVRAELPTVQGEWQQSDWLELSGESEPPTMVQPELGKQGSVQLRWNEVGGATHYLLEVSRDETFTDLLHAAQPDRCHATFYPPAGGRYWFRVAACEGEQRGSYSEGVSIQVSQSAPPRLLPLDSVEADAIFEVAWMGIPGCAHYELQESTSEQFDPAKTRTIRVFHPGQKVALPGRPRGRYVYRVKSVDESGQSSRWSDTLTVEIV